MGGLPATGELVALEHNTGCRSHGGPRFDEMVFQRSTARVQRAGRYPALVVSAAGADPDGEISGLVAASQVGVLVLHLADKVGH